ncbi:MAG: hypothetical protein PHV13_02480 [Candidatus ainarchaeum sp.]|nr:hypothetical protein [Candidatus ainarchaeum sp.]
MFLYQTPPARRQLVRPVKPPNLVNKDPTRVRWFRRFFRDPEAGSHGNKRAGDLNLKSTWSNLLAAKRLLIQGELASIAAKPRDAEVPECGLQMERVSIAMYLLGRAGTIIRKTADYVPADLWPVLQAVMDLLEKPFFTEPQHVVLFHYNGIKASFKLLGFDILDADAAARKYINHVKTRVAQMRKNRQGPPKDVDVMA